MRKIFTYILVFTGLAVFASCQKEMVSQTEGGEEIAVTYSVAVSGQPDTKASGGIAADRLYWAAYQTADENPSSDTDMSSAKLLSCGNCAVTGPQVQASVKLIKDQNYVVIFWAQNQAGHYIVPEDGDLRVIRMNTSAEAIKANDHSREAFYGVDFVVSASAGKNPSIELKRPVAQINVATLKDGFQIGDKTLNVTHSSFTVNALPTAFNPVTAALAEPKDITFAAADVLKDQNDHYISFESSGNEYVHLAMNYVFASPAQSTNYDVSVTILAEDASDIVLDVPNVPVKANYRTNIIGNLLTANTTYSINFETDFLPAPQPTIEFIADGVSKEGDVYYIGSAAGLRWLANTVNNMTSDTRASDIAPFAGKTVMLVNDIDLSGSEWTPIGNSWTNAFCGTFDGNGKTISGMTIKCATANGHASLFGTIRSAQIRNLTILNAYVTCTATTGEEHFFGAGLVSVAYVASTITGVTVTDSYISGNNKVGGLVGYNNENGFIAEDCHVIRTKVETKNTEDGGSVGGFIGMASGIADINNTGNIALTFKNCTVEECTINAINSANAGKRANGKFIGSYYVVDAGWALNIENCRAEATLTDATTTTYASGLGDMVGGVRNDNGITDYVLNIDGVQYRPNKVMLYKGNSWTEYDALYNALSDAESGSIISIANDYTVSDKQITISAKNLTICAVPGSDVTITGRFYITGTSHLELNNINLKWNGESDYPIELHNLSADSRVALHGCHIYADPYADLGALIYISDTYTGVLEVVDCTLDNANDGLGISGCLSGNSAEMSKINGNIFKNCGVHLSGVQTYQNLEFKNNSVDGVMKIDAQTNAHSLKNIWIENNTLEKPLDTDCLKPEAIFENCYYKGNTLTLPDALNGKFIIE